MKKCNVSKCNRKYYAKGFCKLHYDHKRIHGRTFIKPLKEKLPEKCRVELCTKKPRAKGYCERHYQQITKIGKISGDPSRTKFDRNEAVFEEGIVRIRLYNSKDEVIAETLIDREIYPKVKSHKWRRDPSGYASTGDRKNGNYTTIAHIVLGITMSNNLIPDHINRDKLDSRRCNLRIATVSQNCMNQKKRSDNTSGVKGVSWDSERNKWTAYIQIGKKRVSLGRFKDKNSAASARRSAEMEHYAEFAPT